MGIDPSSQGTKPADPRGSSVGGGSGIGGACTAGLGASASPPAHAGERRHHRTAGARSPVVPPARPIRGCLAAPLGRRRRMTTSEGGSDGR
jgi:hypothetical protein